MKLWRAVLACWWFITLSEPHIALAQSSTDINAADLLALLRIGQPVVFDSVTIHGEFNLTELYKADQSGSLDIAVPIKITHSRFVERVSAFDPDRGVAVIFEQNVDLRGTTFAAGADFIGAQFQQAANLVEAQFDDKAQFNAAVFNASANFHSVRFNHDANFRQARFNGSVDFMEAVFGRQALFTGTEFAKDVEAEYIGASFAGQADFVGAYFTSAAFFLQAQFHGEADFSGASFRDVAHFRESEYGDAVHLNATKFATVVDFSGAHFTHSLDLSQTTYQTLILTDFDLATLRVPAAPDVYQATLRKLESNFRAQDQLDLANEAVYRRNESERSARPPMVQLLEWVFLDLPFGYGVRPWHTWLVSSGLIVLFALFYYPADVIRKVPLAEPKLRERKLAIRLAEIPLAREGEFPDLPARPQPARPSFQRTRRAIQALRYSFTVFTKVGFGEHVAVRRTTIVVIEWLLGLALIAGFFYTLTNTVPLLSALLKAIL